MQRQSSPMPGMTAAAIATRHSDCLDACSQIPISADLFPSHAMCACRFFTTAPARKRQAIPLRRQHLDELAPPRDQRPQVRLQVIAIGRGTARAGWQTGRAAQHPARLFFPGGPGPSQRPDAPRIDDRDGQAGDRERTRDPGFVAAGGFQHDDARLQLAEALTSAAQPRSSFVVRQRAAGSVDHATSKVSFATSMPTPQEPGIGFPFPRSIDGRAQPCECEMRFNLPTSSARRSTTLRPSYTTEWNHGSRGLPRPRSTQIKTGVRGPSEGSSYGAIPRPWARAMASRSAVSVASLPVKRPSGYFAWTSISE